MAIHNDIGMVSWCGLSVPFADRMRMIRGAGFTATALWWEDKHEVARRLKHLAPDIVREAGLAIDHIHMPYRYVNRLWSPDDDERNEGLRMARSWIDDCARHGVGTMVIHATLGRDAPEHFEVGVESFRILAEEAGECGVTIALENMRDAPTLLRLLEAAPTLRLCYDLAHDTLFSDSTGALLHEAHNHLLTTHINDHDGKRDRHWIPGDGVANYSGLVHAMKSSPHSVRAMVEAKYVPGDESEEEFLNRAYRASVDLVT